MTPIEKLAEQKYHWLVNAEAACAKGLQRFLDNRNDVDSAKTGAMMEELIENLGFLLNWTRDVIRSLPTDPRARIRAIKQFEQDSDKFWVEIRRDKDYPTN